MSNKAAVPVLKVLQSQPTKIMFPVHIEDTLHQT